jgi:hypothetical protein
MKTNVKQEWIKALKYGAYAQGTNCLLRRDNEDAKYCCLGVLVNIFEKEHCLTFNKDSVGFGDNHKYTLPSIVAEWSGVTKDQENILMELNDKLVRFGVIARVIDLFPQEN